MWRRATIWGTAMVVAAGAIGGALASAQPETPRQTYSDRFTTEAPGASTGRTYAIDYVNPDDPEGKPRAFRGRPRTREGVGLSDANSWLT